MRKDTKEVEIKLQVVNNAFNRENYPELIGQKYTSSNVPSYVIVMPVV